MRLMPRSFAGQLALLLVIALFVAQTVAFILFAGESVRHARERFQDIVISRMATLLRAMPDLPASARPHVLDAASSRFLSYWITDDPPQGRGPGRFGDFVPELALYLGVSPSDVHVTLLDEDPLRGRRAEIRRPRDPLDDDGDEDDGWRQGRRDGDRRDRDGRRHPFWIALSVRMPDGQWLNAVTGPPPQARPFGRVFIMSLGFSALAVALAAALLARRMVRPVRRLADAAERYGRGESFEPLAEDGPDEARRTVHAFNRMRERLDRFVADRTRMLAAISHDLRTPMTSLRLRAELVDDEETREKLIETIEEMQHMTEAALAFAKADQAAEETRTVDLQALVESLADDLSELGHEVSVEETGPVVVRCRPVALRRAIRNVMENAVRYGHRARVATARTGGRVEIRIADDGPGIPDGEIERMFEPFVRAETSRSRETGGIGLGLAIARTIMRAHGGDIALSNREGGGLDAVLTLPADTT